MTLTFRHVEAFATVPGSGNPAAVIRLSNWRPDADLLAIAADLALPATAFVVQDKGDPAIRWFAPTGEIRLCGHGALAAAHVMLAAEPGATMRFAVQRSDAIQAARLDDGTVEIGLPALRVAPGEWPEAAAALGGSPHEVWRSADRYNVFFYRTEAEIRALAPDPGALSALGDHQFICTAPGEESDVVSRVFTGAGGGREDSATGSAHAVLAPLWAARLGRTQFSAIQASARGGRFACRLDGALVWLGGRCLDVREGTVQLSG